MTAKPKAPRKPRWSSERHYPGGVESLEPLPNRDAYFVIYTTPEGDKFWRGIKTHFTLVSEWAEAKGK